MTLGCWHALASPSALESSLLEASREDLISPKGNLVAISKLCLAKLRVRMKLSLQSPSLSHEHGALKAGRAGQEEQGGQGVQAAEKRFWAQQFVLVCILLWNISFCLFISPSSPFLFPPPHSVPPPSSCFAEHQNPGICTCQAYALPLSYIPNQHPIF